MIKMNNVTLYWSLGRSRPLAFVLQQHQAQAHSEHGGVWTLSVQLKDAPLLANWPLLSRPLCVQWTCWACRWRARCSTSTGWSRTSSCSTSPSWSPVWPACTSGWSRATLTWSTSRCASTCASTGCSTSTTRTWSVFYTYRRSGEGWTCSDVFLFCCLTVVAPERSGLCLSKPESSHSARLTWRISTDVSNTHRSSTYAPI